MAWGALQGALGPASPERADCADLFAAGDIVLAIVPRICSTEMIALDGSVVITFDVAGHLLGQGPAITEYFTAFPLGSDQCVVLGEGGIAGLECTPSDDK